MTRAGAIEIACLYGPLAGSALLAWQVRPTKRDATGLLFASAWMAALLPWCDSLARLAGLWAYESRSPALAGMPLALYFGWIIGWGIFAPLLAQALGGRAWLAAAILVILDLRAMPEMTPVLSLDPGWWQGELAVVALLLIPALLLARWTSASVRIGTRCAMLVPTFGGIFFGLPLLVETGGVPGAAALWQSLPAFAKAGIPIATAALALPGLSAVRDLALSGGGTPVPLDPPRRLVTHGIYAFVRNPMQLSMTLLLLLEAALLWSPWPAVLAAIGLVYSEGFARWSENLDMLRRFGPAWTRYRESVRPWWPHWSPRIGEPCELWFDASCGICSEVAAWIDRHHPRQLVLRDAAGWPGPPLQRITWHHPPSGRTEQGVAAIAMTLQHFHLGWALPGWFAGLPGIRQGLQACFDAAGAGRRG